MRERNFNFRQAMFYERQGEYSTARMYYDRSARSEKLMMKYKENLRLMK